MYQDNKKLKICVSSTGDTLDSEIDPRFGRCEHFIIVEVEDGSILNIEAIKNAGAEQDRGAGISAAEQIGKLGVNVIITGDVGPKAAQIIEQLKIEVCQKIGNGRVAVSEYLEEGIIESDENTSTAVEEKDEPLSDQRMFIPLMDDNGENSEISLHFGHAPYFGLYDVATAKLIIEKNELNHSDPSKTPVDQIIEQVNPTIVYAQDMGMRAVNLFTEKNILLKTGPYKIAKEVMDNIDKLDKLTKGCNH